MIKEETARAARIAGEHVRVEAGRHPVLHLRSRGSGRVGLLPALRGGVPKSSMASPSTIDDIVNVFGRLHAYARTRTDLPDLLPVAAELDRQARTVERGVNEVPPLLITPATIPSRQVADEIVAILRGLPPIDDLDRQSALTLAKLLENLVVGVTANLKPLPPAVITKLSPFKLIGYRAQFQRPAHQFC
jgi:hypothetical protein